MARFNERGEIVRERPNSNISCGCFLGILIILIVIALVGVSVLGVGLSYLLSPSQPNYNEPIYVIPTTYSSGEPSYSTPDQPQIIYARISNEVSEVNLRNSPGYKSKDENIDVIIKIPSGATVVILNGPEYADNLNWWYIQWNGYTGWVADHTGSGRTILEFNP